MLPPLVVVVVVDKDPQIDSLRQTVEIYVWIISGGAEGA